MRSLRPTWLLAPFAVMLTGLGGAAAGDNCAPGIECAGAGPADPSSGTPTPVPHLAAGPAWSVELRAGTSSSAFSTAPAFGESAAVGSYLSSSGSTAWSAELLETCNFVLDRTTPQFGLIGVAARHFARPEDPLIGPPGKTIDFQRLAAGVAFTYDGGQLVAGVGVEASVAYLVHGPHGIDVHVGTYFFDASDLPHDTLVMMSIGYVFSPVKDRPRTFAPPFIPQRDERRACRELSAYRDAVAEARKQAATICPNRSAPECDRVYARIAGLDAALNRCMIGVDIGPPELPDAP
jgi:hypothetical protein